MLHHDTTKTTTEQKPTKTKITTKSNNYGKKSLKHSNVPHRSAVHECPDATADASPGQSEGEAWRLAQWHEPTTSCITRCPRRGRISISPRKLAPHLRRRARLGLAHFLEHMAFNGTTNYPGKNLLNYLQGKGIRFGADINAYTAFDETVYNINNVPTTDKPLVDSVLLALHDWSGEILLEEAEIDAERGVIQEEWRQRNNAQFRMLMSILPEIYKEYQYQQSPIGKMEVVMNFKPEVLRAYYKKWYRPDQQGYSDRR